MDFLVVWSNQAGCGDYAVEDGDIAGDASLDSDVLVSLLTDRVADPGDALPSGTTDPRGWWGDTAFTANASAPVDRIGSKLWLRVNALLTQATLNQLCADVYQALSWMIEDGVAQSVTCTAKQIGVGNAALIATITRQVNGQPVSMVYDVAWAATKGVVSVQRRSSAS